MLQVFSGLGYEQCHRDQEDDWSSNDDDDWDDEDVDDEEDEDDDDESDEDLEEESLKVEFVFYLDLQSVLFGGGTSTI